MTTVMSTRRAVGLSLIVGLVGWAMLWLGTTSRAGWDSLVYHKFAFEYAGLDRDHQDARSWELFARYGSTSLVLYVSESLDGEAWHFDLEPEQARWGLQYRMRPAYPALVAAAFPVLGARAPLAVSALAVVLLVVTTFAGLNLLAGLRVAVLATGLGLLNIFLTPWLVNLMPDGLAIGLWALTLTTGALWISQGRWIWLAALGLTVFALCLTRPLGVLAPAVFALSALGAAITRAGVWRAFAVATLVAIVPALAVTWLFTSAGYPGWLDLLQDLPTQHFSVPDVADPVAWIVTMDLGLLGQTMPVGLLGRPLVAALLVGGVIGLLLPGRWWTSPFLAAMPVVLLSFLLHPSATEIDRTLAPAWVSVNTGLALLVVVGAVRWRTRILALVDRFSAPPDGAAAR